MSLRSSTDYESGGNSFHMVLPSTRHSRARGNPGLFSDELAWIPAFAGMTERRRPLRSTDHPTTVLSKELTKVSDTAFGFGYALAKAQRRQVRNRKIDNFTNHPVHFFRPLRPWRSFDFTQDMLCERYSEIRLRATAPSSFTVNTLSHLNPHSYLKPISPLALALRRSA
jgi:hypothetical protein